MYGYGRGGQEEKLIKDRYEIQVNGSLGQGAFGKVFCGRDRRTNAYVAIKRFREVRDEGIESNMMRELILLSELTHMKGASPYIMKLLDAHYDERERVLYAVCEYAEVDLSDVLYYHERSRRRLSEYTIKTMMKQILSGLEHMHSALMFHRDLKPCNLLVTLQANGSTEAGTVKIADFGLARVYRQPLLPLSSNGVVVTIWYRPPEILLGARHYTKAIDMWAVGCMLAELATLKVLFCGVERGANAFEDHQIGVIFQVLGYPSAAAWPQFGDHPEYPRVANEASSFPLSSRLHETLQNALRSSFGAPKFAPPTGSAASSASSAAGFGSDGAALDGTIPLVQQSPMWATPSDLEHSSLMFDLLQQLLAYDPNRRISASQALSHPWFHTEPLPGSNVFVAPTSNAAHSGPLPYKKKPAPPPTDPLPAPPPYPHASAPPASSGPLPSTNPSSRLFS